MSTETQPSLTEPGWLHNEEPVVKAQQHPDSGVFNKSHANFCRGAFIVDYIANGMVTIIGNIVLAIYSIVQVMIK